MFESLMVLDEYQWPMWIPSASVDAHEPISVVYRRLHHRIKHVTQFSKKCQETCTVKFRQTVVNGRIIQLAMLEAQLNNCL